MLKFNSQKLNKNEQTEFTGTDVFSPSNLGAWYLTSARNFHRGKQFRP